MATLTLPDGTTLTFTPIKHVGQEKFTVDGYVYYGELTIKIPGREVFGCPV